jgi:phosphoglycerate dehydrogenase-like enzyme
MCGKLAAVLCGGCCGRVRGGGGRYVMGYVLRSERRLELAADQQRAKLWNQEPFTRGTRPVAGLTLGLLGCGDIGW